MKDLLAAIFDNDRTKLQQLLKADVALATCLAKKDIPYDGKIVHWFYVGDTALHLAAAGYRVDIVRMLLTAGGNPNSVQNRRKSGPLHYAADGYINSSSWNAKRQVKTIQCLLDAGADINALDSNGATPLHRAVRTRCAAAVQFLLKRGGDPTKKNQSGSTAFHLAVQNTGRGGTGEDQVKAAQRRIIKGFLSFGVKTTLKDGKGKSVVDCAKGDWIHELLLENAP